MYAFLLERIKALRADGFDLGDDDVGTVFFDYAFQGVAVKHGEHFGLVCHLHGRRPGVGVAGDDVLPKTLCRDDKFLAQFA